MVGKLGRVCSLQGVRWMKGPLKQVYYISVLAHLALVIQLLLWSLISIWRTCTAGCSDQLSSLASCFLSSSLIKKKKIHFLKGKLFDPLKYKWSHALCPDTTKGWIKTKFANQRKRFVWAIADGHKLFFVFTSKSNYMYIFQKLNIKVKILEIAEKLRFIFSYRGRPIATMLRVHLSLIFN